MTDYLEEAKSYLGFEGKDKDTWSEQVNAIRPIAFALVAIAERLDATAQDIASRVELASETVLNKRLDRLVEIERDIETVKRQQTANLDAVAALEDRWVRWAGDARIDERLENLERGKVTIGKGGEVVEMVDAATAGRLDEMDSVIKRLANRLSDLEAPDAPRVGEWQRCGECEGKGIDPDPDEEGARCGVCGGRGMVEVYRGEGGGEGDIVWPEAEAQPALWEKLEQAKDDIMRFERRLIWRDEQLNKSQDYTKQLEYKLNKILEVAKKADEKDMSFLVLKDEIIKATY